MTNAEIAARLDSSSEDHDALLEALRNDWDSKVLDAQGRWGHVPRPIYSKLPLIGWCWRNIGAAVYGGWGDLLTDTCADKREARRLAASVVYPSLREETQASLGPRP